MSKIMFLSDQFLELQSKTWRFQMWRKGYGSYTEIDEQVSRGELTPFKEYPDKRTAPSPQDAP